MPKKCFRNYFELKTFCEQIVSGFEDMDDDVLHRYIKIRKIQEKILKLGKEGLSIEEISGKVGWSYETVKVVLGPEYKSSNSSTSEKST